jgi:predicted DNA-binding helix-hairpin-helix protein
MIREAGLWADRLSANIELPTEKSLMNLAPQKSGKLIFGAMDEVSRTSREIEEDRRHQLKSAPVYAPAGQSTQLIVGASGEDDRTIIGLSGALYRKYSLRRVYYSAYMPVAAQGGLPDPRLPDYRESGPFLPGFPPEGGIPPESGLPTKTAPAIREAPRNLLIREHRLYQADWLMRFYRFSPDEIVAPEASFLDSVLDPKTAWALRHLDYFPVEIKSAGYEELLRVPGIGAKSARRIIEIRRSRPLSFDGLKRIGVVLKRARYFITLGGNFLDRPDNPRRLRRILADEEEALQLPLFEF